ncbi:MFS transporter [Ornithinicoccus halotolerans]|uniref:MFS transporter n=1 Tax=Ornithinicoccus halotolerans TaxID=1748220 RepID=UPI001295BEDA|nr:MFS transporter [Ornithinicoccus halotolerans]
MSPRRHLLDVRPLRSSAPFRRLWLGSSLSALGQQVTTVAVLFQVWELTGDPVWTGVLGLVRAVPLIVCGLLGGTWADAVDRRKLVLLTTLGQLVAGAGLALQAVLRVESLVLLLGLVAVMSACGGLGAPAKRTFVPRLLPADLVAAGVALQMLAFQVAMLVGPALAGAVIGWWGLTVCYLLETVTAAVSLWAVWRLPAVPVARGQGAGWRATVAGVRFVTRRPVLRGLMVTDLVATLTAMPIALFPLVNEERFGGDPQVLGLLLSAIAVGGTAAGLLLSGAVTRARRLGRVQFVAAGVWGLGLTGFGLAGQLWLALATLAVAGAADTLSVTARGAIVQLATPDSHRGRVSAVDHVVGAAGPDVGNARAGFVAGLTSAPVALVSGGLACVVGVVWVALSNRELRRYEQPAGSAAQTAEAGAAEAHDQIDRTGVSSH